METVLRTAAIFFFLLLVFRISGKRTLGQITIFDFVLLLIIGEAVQQAMIVDDYSLTNAFLVVLTLVGLEILLTVLKQHFPKLDKLVDGIPLIIIDNGRMMKERMEKNRVDESEILEAARELRGLERLDQIKYAVLERDGKITIIPQQPTDGAR